MGLLGHSCATLNVRHGSKAAAMNTSWILQGIFMIGVCPE
jgi:hypothetical protein